MLALPAFVVASAVAIANAAALQRLSSEFQNEAPGSAGGEIFTSAGVPGTVVYDKLISLPQNVAYISFSAQGDTHGGAALLMTASITDSAGNKTVCQPFANAGGSAAIGAPWMTLLKLPTDDDSTTGNNCDDGGGGTADCHDNAFSFSACCPVTSPDSGTTHEVKIAMASSIPGDTVFYEDATINIDSGPNPGGGFCQGVGTGVH